MGCKGPGTGTAPGYWGRDPHQRIVAEDTANKIKTLLIDKLNSLGKTVFLWQQIYSNTPGALQCSCVKNTTKRSDITCVSCYGTDYIGGYSKFAHQTLVFPSIISGITLTNTHLDQTIKPHRILLNDLAVSGTIVWSPQPFSNSGYQWDYRVDAPNIKATNTVVVEFSTNGTTYYPISNINTPAIQPTGLGNLYIRVTLTRASAADRSPEFEIIRVRHPIVDYPYIKILRPQVTEVPSWLQYGLRMEHLGERFWTAPLDYFDPNIIHDTPAARILENAMYARIDGINAGNRYITTRLSYSEEFGIFTHQSFETRISQPEEIYYKVF